MLRLEMLPAHHGDCLLIEYGNARSPKRILIDGGTPESFDAVDARLARIGESVELELLVVTHVDEDHIGGTLAHLVKNRGRLAPKEIWFNAYRHLFPPDMQGPAQGEGLSTAIEEAGWAWNAAFARTTRSVVVPDPETELPVIDIAGAKLTLLSPTWAKLQHLQGTWEKACKKAKLIPGEGAPPADVLGKRPPPKNLSPTKVRALAAEAFKRDSSKPNGSSIAFLFEYRGKRLLLTGDAHPDALVGSLDRLGQGPIEVDAWKFAHHGSRGNLDKELLERVHAKRYLISTDSGTFGHPDPEAIARLLVHGESEEKQLVFNYDTAYTRPWADVGLREEFRYSVAFADPESDGHVVIEDF